MTYNSKSLIKKVNYLSTAMISQCFYGVRLKKDD